MSTSATKIRENSKLEALDSHVKCRRTSATTKSTTRLCSSTWQRLNKTTEPSLAVNKFDKEKNNSSKESKNSTARLTLKHDGGSTKSRGETCRQLRQSGIKPAGRLAFGILSILQGLTICVFFSELGRVSVAWRRPPANRRRGENSTPTNTARTELHSMIKFHHANTRGSRAGRLRIAHLCVMKQWSFTCHVSFHAALDTVHKHKFSLTYLIYLSDDLSNTHKTFGTRWIFTLRCSMAEWRINTNPISHRL